MLYKKIPLSVRCYLFGIFSYNCIGTYYYSKLFLNAYRNDELHWTDKVYINSELRAVTYGANYNKYDIFVNSLFFPVTSVIKIIPHIVLKFNPKIE
jgi:hypothetical protein